MRLLCFSLVATAFVATAACETSSAVEPGSAGAEALATRSADSVCTAIELALRRRRLRCYLDPMPSVVYLEENDHVGCAALASAVTAGDVVMDPTALRACESELDAAGCETDPSTTFDPHGACAGIFHPVDPNGPCRMHLECGAGRYCSAANAFCSGTCRPLPGAGDRCGQQYECGYGLGCFGTGAVCATAITHPRTPVVLAGGACSDDGDSPMCEPTASCRAGLCVRGQGLGGACASNDDCAVGVCTNGTCAPHRPPGRTCASDRECADHLSCVAGVCVATCH